jgi:hypothetical protein
MPSNLEVVKAWVKACNQTDVERALSLCSPSMELVESTTLPGAVRAAGAGSSLPGALHHPLVRG